MNGRLCSVIACSLKGRKKCCHNFPTPFFYIIPHIASATVMTIRRVKIYLFLLLLTICIGDGSQVTVASSIPYEMCHFFTSFHTFLWGRYGLIKIVSQVRPWSLLNRR
jgi:hypothetical protein